MSLPSITIIYGSNEEAGGVHQATLSPDREFWRYLFAGLYLPTTPPAIAVRDAGALLAELEKGGES